MAEALLRRHLTERGVTAHVHSAGLLGEGWPATDQAIAVMADIGMDLSGHRSRTATADMVEASDLVVTMTRQHAVEISILAPGYGRLFQLRNLVRQAEAAGRRPRDQTLTAWLQGLDGQLGGVGILGSNLQDDIADPIGLPVGAYEQTRQTLDDLCRRLSAVIA
jgi:protein-tyrosine-phosphatase